MNQEPRNQQPTQAYQVESSTGEYPTQPGSKPSVTSNKGPRLAALRRSTVAMGLAAVVVVSAGAVALSQTGGPAPRPVVLAGQSLATEPTELTEQVPAEATTTTEAPATKSVAPTAPAKVNPTCVARDKRERAEELREAKLELAEALETPAQEAARERAEDLAEAQEDLREARETPAQEAARERAEDLAEAREDIRDAKEDILCGEFRG